MMNQFRMLTRVIFATGCLWGSATGVNGQNSLIISELMASNTSSIKDEDGDFSDWIEIQNSGRSTINLAGWFLTDDKNEPTQWRFPSVSIGPGGLILVFASGKDRTLPGRPLHTNFKLSAGGEYLGLFEPDGTTPADEMDPEFPKQFDDISYGVGLNVRVTKYLSGNAPGTYLVPQTRSEGTGWMNPGFNDSSWKTGNNGIGYQSSVPGFSVKFVKSNISVGQLTTAETVLINPDRQSRVVNEIAPNLNYFETGSLGRFGNDRPFPGGKTGVDVNDYVVEATATVRIPSAGQWTFGVSSDDGFRLDVGNFTFSFPNPRAPADSFATFNFTSAGDYDLRLIYYERGGGAELELFALKGSFNSWNNLFRLVGDTGKGGLAVSTADGSAGQTESGNSEFLNTDIFGEMYQKQSSVYLRLPFEVSSPSLIQSLTLRMRYTDGFIAYLNGVPMASRNAPENSDGKSRATGTRSNSILFEDIGLDNIHSILVPGENLLAIHGLNESAGDSEFLIQAEISQIEIEGNTLNYFSEASPGELNHGGFIAFADKPRFSHKRGFFEESFDLTLSSEISSVRIWYTTDGTKPSPSNGQLYSQPIRIAKTSTIQAMAVADSFEPSKTVTHTFLFLNDVIRQSPTGAAPAGWPTSWGSNVHDYAMDPDIVNNRLYNRKIIDSLRSIPTFSIVMNLDDLFGRQNGIYANPRQDGRSWERPCSVELIDPDNGNEFQTNAGIRIRGGFSRSTNNPKHAFRLFFRKEYGSGKLKHPVFGEEATDRFDGFDLRTFQNYSWSFQGDGRGVFLRDQSARDSQLAMGHSGARGDFYHLYINGHYWGLYNSCERPEASFAESYFGGSKDNYDVVKVEPYNASATDGNLDAWRQLWTLSRQNITRNDLYFALQGKNAQGQPDPNLTNLLDVPNLIDYMLIIYHGGNLDAPISNFLGNNSPNNWYGIRDRTGTQGFRFFVWDAEHSLLPWDINRDRTGPFAAGNTFNKSNPQYIFQQLVDNPEFKMQVADHIHRHFFNGGILTPESAITRFMERKEEIDQAVIAESARWGDSKRGTPFTRDQHWLNAINDVVENYLPRRSNIVLNQFKSKGWYPNITAPSFNQHGGSVDPGFNLTMTAPSGDIYYTTDGTDPRRIGGSIAPSARRVQGSLALNESATVKSRVRRNGQWSALNQSDFVLIQTFTELAITEIMYHPPRFIEFDGDDFEFIELKNIGNRELDLSGVHFSNGVQFQFPNGSLLSPGGFALIVSNREQFSLKYPNVEVAGVYKGKLNNGGERLTLSHAVGTIIETTRFQDALPWPSSPDGKGFSLVRVSSSANSDPESPTAWRASSLIGGSPGFDDPTTNLVPVLINEILTHTDLPVVDAVELFNPNAEPADISHWYLSDDRNTPKKFRIPQGTIVPPEAYRVFDEFDFNQNPGTDGSFSLSSHGEEVFLFSADDSGTLKGYSHGFTFPAGENAVTFGRHVISSGRVHFPPLLKNTLGGPNSEPKVGPVVLNEIHYHPSPSDEEFIELKNISNDSVPLFDPEFPENLWKLSGINFDFPADVTLPPKGLIVITSTEPELFRTKFSISESIQIFGPFAGSLQNGGERLQLTRPDTPDVDDQGNSVVPYLLVDQVRYDNNSPWPLEPGGQGPSLERIQPSAYGNEPLNWRTSLGDPSPGRNNDGNRLPLVDAGDDQSAVAGLFPAPLAIAGTAQDDGLPKPLNRLLTRWQQVSGPGPVRFENENALSTTAFFPGTGDYILSLTADDGELQANDTVSIQITRPAADADFITAGSEWKYLDNGSNQNTAWRNLNFNDATWKSGAAQLGYGDGDEATTLSFGPNGNSKFITAYFRKTFMISNRSAVKEMMLRLVRDDGAVIYLNGNEVFRSSMPSGTIGFQTLATAVAGGADESRFFESPIDPTRLRNGVNLLAVEIHQANLSSSDISFDLVLGGTVTEVNQAPEVVAGNDRTVNVEDQLNLGGSWTDDGLPEAQSVPSILWTRVTGPGAVQFNPEDAMETTIRFSEPGIYTLRLTVNDGALTGSDDIRVTVEGDTGPFSEWLAQHFTASELEQVDIVGRNADPDLDHQTNFEEFIAGTDPKNPESLLEVRDVTVKTGDSESVHIRFFAVEGKTYTIEFTDDLNGDPWQGMSNVGPLPVSGWLTLKDPSGVQLNRYYRIATPKRE